MRRLAILCALCFSITAQSKPMNVVFILADDLGWADTTLYGHTEYYRTPNLERLAKRGMTFTRAYANSPLCSPTRASILTGQTPARHGSTAPQHHEGAVRMKPSVNEGANAPGNKALQTLSVTRLDTGLPTLGKLISKAGYATAHFGKWHLGPEPYSPLEHGFDVDVPHFAGPGPKGFMGPWTYHNLETKDENEHIEDRMAREAVTWMESVKEGKKPFFMNYWMFSVHAPFDAKSGLIEEYRKKIDPNAAQRSPTYAAMIHSMDDAVGTLLDAVDASGTADSTIIFFTSDNGGNMYNEIDDTRPTSNLPLRGGKATMFEGGVRVPAVIVWPGITKPGSRSSEIIQSADFYPTLLKQLRIKMPAGHEVDGMDITPALRGGTLDRRGIFTFFPHSPPVPDWLPPSMSVISRDWKLIRLFHQGENGAHDYLLYNLKEDIGEQNNLAKSHPEKVQLLDRMIEDHINRVGAVAPVPNPNFDPEAYRPEKIGVQAQKKRGAKRPPSKPVAGWIAGGTCTLSKDDGALVANSSGSDPYFSVNNFKPLKGGSFKVSFEMTSNASGTGAVYYNKPANENRLISFQVKHDGKPHVYTTEIPARMMDGLRIDPARGGGKIEINWVRLTDSSGKKVRSWEF